MSANKNENEGKNRNGNISKNRDENISGNISGVSGIN